LKTVRQFHNSVFTPYRYAIPFPDRFTSGHFITTKGTPIHENSENKSHHPEKSSDNHTTRTPLELYLPQKQGIITPLPSSKLSLILRYDVFTRIPQAVSSKTHRYHSMAELSRIQN
jgi:hypothetical protein